MSNTEVYIVCGLITGCILIALGICIFVYRNNHLNISQIKNNSDIHEYVVQAQRKLTSSNVQEAGSAFMLLISYGVIALCSILNNSEKYDVKNNQNVFIRLLMNEPLKALAKNMSKISYKG